MYSYVRFRWWTPLDLKKAVEELSGFNNREIIHEEGGEEVTLYRDLRNEVEVQADTLQALLSPLRVTLNQREERPFTARDMELREKVMRLYPRDRSTPFPWSFSVEPRFEKKTP
jgi:hypothetical protein